jgi:hypothetical protein
MGHAANVPYWQRRVVRDLIDSELGVSADSKRSKPRIDITLFRA